MAGWTLDESAVKEHIADRLALQETARSKTEEKAVVVGDRNIEYVGVKYDILLKMIYRLAITVEPLQEYLI